MNRPESLRDEIATIIQHGHVEGLTSEHVAEAVMHRIRGHADTLMLWPVAALMKINRWFGEFPETGRKWGNGTDMSYLACYGSNGERDFMRGVARDALKKLHEVMHKSKGGDGNGEPPPEELLRSKKIEVAANAMKRSIDAAHDLIDATGLAGERDANHRSLSERIAMALDAMRLRSQK